MSPSEAMRNCGGSDCFLGNESRSALTGIQGRFGEVGKVYGEESGWHRARVVFCVRVPRHSRDSSRASIGLADFGHAEGPDNGECQAMWIMDVGL